MTLKDGDKEIIDNVSSISCIYAPKELPYFQCDIFSPNHQQEKDSIHSEKITDVNLFNIKDALLFLVGNADDNRSFFQTEVDMGKKVRCVIQNDYDRGTDKLDCFIKI
jgi:hypothetical protein